MQSIIDELQEKLMIEMMKQKVQLAYEQGLEDARGQQAYPPLLRKQHVAEIFQVELPTVENIIRKEGFPKSTAVQARYPRDEVFDWMAENTEYVHYNANRLSKSIS